MHPATDIGETAHMHIRQAALGFFPYVNHSGQTALPMCKGLFSSLSSLMQQANKHASRTCLKSSLSDPPDICC